MTRILKVLVPIGAVVVALGVIEVGVRAVYQERWYAAPPFQPGEKPAVNADGLRDVDYGPKEPGAYRVLLLGDSFTFGTGVADDAAVWPARLEAELQTRRPVPGKTRYEVLNGGLPGSLTNAWVTLLDAQLPRFAPDLVVAVFFLRDAVRIDGATMAAAIDRRARSLWPTLFTWSRAYRYLRERWAATRMAGEFVELFTRAYGDVGPETEEWKVARANLRELRARSERAGARFAVVAFPVLFELDREPYPFAPVLAALERFCADERMTYRSLLPAFAGRDASALWVAVGNQHPNAEGHAIAAEAMRSIVEELATAR